MLREPMIRRRRLVASLQSKSISGQAIGSQRTGRPSTSRGVSRRIVLSLRVSTCGQGRWLTWTTAGRGA